MHEWYEADVPRHICMSGNTVKVMSCENGQHRAFRIIYANTSSASPKNAFCCALFYENGAEKPEAKLF